MRVTKKLANRKARTESESPDFIAEAHGAFAFNFLAFYRDTSCGSALGEFAGNVENQAPINIARATASTRIYRQKNQKSQVEA